MKVIPIIMPLMNSGIFWEQIRKERTLQLGQLEWPIFYPVVYLSHSPSEQKSHMCHWQESSSLLIKISINLPQATHIEAHNQHNISKKNVFTLQMQFPVNPETPLPISLHPSTFCIKTSQWLCICHSSVCNGFLQVSG